MNHVKNVLIGIVAIFVLFLIFFSFMSDISRSQFYIGSPPLRPIPVEIPPGGMDYDEYLMSIDTTIDTTGNSK